MDKLLNELFVSFKLIFVGIKHIPSTFILFIKLILSVLFWFKTLAYVLIFEIYLLKTLLRNIKTILKNIKENPKIYLLMTTKACCLVVLLTGAVIKTHEYLDYPYVY